MFSLCSFPSILGKVIYTCLVRWFLADNQRSLDNERGLNKLLNSHRETQQIIENKVPKPGIM